MNYKLLEAEAKNGARLLSEKLKLSNNYEETKEILDDFCVFINRYASKKTTGQTKVLQRYQNTIKRIEKRSQRSTESGKYSGDIGKITSPFLSSYMTKDIVTRRYPK